MATPSTSDPSAKTGPQSNFLTGFAIILAFNLAGLGLTRFIPLPGPVLGLGLLAIGLFSGWIKLAWVDRGASALLQNMMLFFVPALVGIIEHIPLLGPHAVAFVLAVVVSLIVVLLVTGGSATLLQKQSKEEPKLNTSTAHGLE